MPARAIVAGVTLAGVASRATAGSAAAPTPGTARAAAAAAATGAPRAARQRPRAAGRRAAAGPRHPRRRPKAAAALGLDADAVRLADVAGAYGIVERHIGPPSSTVHRPRFAARDVRHDRAADHLAVRVRPRWTVTWLFASSFAVPAITQRPLPGTSGRASS